MEAICSFETSVDIQRTTRRYIPEDSTLHKRLCQNLKADRWAVGYDIRIMNSLYVLYAEEVLSTIYLLPSPPESGCGIYTHHWTSWLGSAFSEKRVRILRNPVLLPRSLYIALCNRIPSFCFNVNINRKRVLNDIPSA
jgi:hypothetical protein